MLVALGLGSIGCGPGDGDPERSAEADPPPPPPTVAEAAIVLDGETDDWAECPAVSDPPDATDVVVDLRRICAASDSEAFYLLLEWEGTANVEDLPGVLTVELDVDGDPATGWSDYALPGADVLIDFTPMDPAASGEVMHGVRVFTPGADPADPSQDRIEVDVADLGLVFEPRRASDRLELRLQRGTPLPGGMRTFQRDSARARATFADPDGQVLDRTGPISVTLAAPGG